MRWPGLAAAGGQRVGPGSVLLPGQFSTTAKEQDDDDHHHTSTMDRTDRQLICTAFLLLLLLRLLSSSPDGAACRVSSLRARPRVAGKSSAGATCGGLKGSAEEELPTTEQLRAGKSFPSNCHPRRPQQHPAAPSSTRQHPAAPRGPAAAEMAAPAQQPPHLHLAELTATQFIDIWKHFDADGNGYIEGKELENFIKELETARRGTKASMDPSHTAFKEKMKEFMASFDKNSDGRIEMLELAQLLPTEENFLLCFREFVGSSSEFMAAWRKYDSDRSGYIESNELKGFLSDLLKKANKSYDEKKLQEYTQTILRMFDLNGDGKLGLSEMARLLPVHENFLLKFEGIRLTVKEFDSLFTYYDKDGNGYIDEQELDALLKDLCDKNKMDVDSTGLAGYKASIMALSDGGKLYRTELEIVLCRDSAL